MAQSGDVEAAVEARAEVLPGDHGRELDQLLVTETLAKILHQLVVRVRRSGGQRDRVVEDLLLQLAERIALAVARQVLDLLLADTVFSAERRADVQSEHAPDHLGDLELTQILQHLVGLLRLAPGGLEGSDGEHHGRGVGHDAQRVGNFPA